MKARTGPLPRKTLLIVLAITLCLLMLPRRWQDTARVWGVAPLQPVFSGIHALLATAGRAVDFLSSHARLTEENRLLKEEVLWLEAAVRRREAALRRAEGVLKGLGASARRREWPKVAAQVIGADSSAWRRSLLIDKGTRSGIRVGMGAVSGDAVLGRVVATGPWCSRVMLLTDPDCRVAVRSDRSRVKGILEGTGRQCRIKYVGHAEDVRAGDLIVTAGLDEALPAGLVVGRCIESSGGSGELFRNVQVRPKLEPDRLESVIVLLSRPPDRTIDSEVD